MRWETTKHLASDTVSEATVTAIEFAMYCELD